MVHVQGVLFFPVTPFDSGGRIDAGVLRELVATRLHAGGGEIGAIFAACGTGEFHALDAAEVGLVTSNAVELAGDVPVVAGAGGPLAHARACARGAAAAGASALLVMPPYLVEFETAGLMRYIECVAISSALPVIVYHRSPALFDLAAVRALLGIDAVIGVKDGVGDLTFMTEVLHARKRSGRSEVNVLNGLPFAEVRDPDYRQAGIPVYSSSTFVMAPSVALSYRRATEGGDEPRRRLLLDEVFRPLDEIRRRRPGYNVALVKAGVTLSGFPVGSVRPPLGDVSTRDLDDLARILAHGAHLVDDG